ncbi:tRNA (guanosine(37)-N1)-methyltransferase TrmD [Leptospira selangorensis]|uniref:tRNA (guanine-N(1)-)-methyltransferase n=1 Tax=Leptospira selangorensis TaxID=2484982 RepID=A0A4R9FU93_9LEPT|nr:tRNA (guanosine(37)-N1)-methyltransferase TrmD [Leptospira selangorensis]TGK02448.1 tRNA (guanosine(37)-N1)-methyltransferase TrmD [Leptospira selangorensis]TGM11166.1 tRNA (guanosine(37)-N1)-methyltransferase TrmD [Leptospira selangorensis]TGM23081.1 tRNA (guanosine(37)-N1)-methyltransferase TrmD [Leptospira selangorensis]
MKFNFITLFPTKVQAYFSEGLQEKAIQKGVFSVNIVHLRDFSNNKHLKVDDTPYGGGPGMLLKVEPIDLALKSLGEDRGLVILTTPSGIPFDQNVAEKLSKLQKPITLISGYYEGVDHRVTEHLVDIELSLGNYVISAGDLASLCITDAVSRLLPGFLGDRESLEEESHNERDVLEYPQYTKPSEYNGWKVPEILLGGNHAAIESWRNANRKKVDPDITRNL